MKRKTPHGRKMLFVRQQEESDKLAEAVQDNFSGIREAMNELSHSVLLQDETILLGRKLEGAAGQGTSDNGTKRYERYRLRELLREYRKINGGYSDILVYFSNDDYIVASDSANTLENYRRAEEEKYGEIGSKEWETLMKGKHPSLSMMTAGEELTFFVKTIQESKWDRSQINIVFVYEQPKLQNLLFFSRNTGSRFLLWHTGETEEEAGEPWILKSTEYADLEEEDRRALEGAARNREGRVRLPDLGQEAWFHYYSLGEGYELAVYGIQEDYLDSIRDYQVRTVFLLSGFTIASVLLMLYFLRRNYSQVEGLLGMLEISARDSGADNEFQMIGGRLS